MVEDQEYGGPHAVLLAPCRGYAAKVKAIDIAEGASGGYGTGRWARSTFNPSHWDRQQDSFH
jgi:hypothetical protein